MPAPPPESEPAIVRAFGMGMKGEGSNCAKTNQSRLRSRLQSKPLGPHHTVIPAKAGIQTSSGGPWIPAFAGMTNIDGAGLQRTTIDIAVHLKCHSRILAVITRISAVLVLPIAAFPTTTF